MKAEGLGEGNWVGKEDDWNRSKHRTEVCVCNSTLYQMQELK